MFDAVNVTASEIREMKIRGAGRIARAGASALGEFAGSYPGGSLEDFKRDIGAAKKTLLESRPTAVSLWNGVQACVRDVQAASSLEEARGSVVRNSALFVEMSSNAVRLIAEFGAKRIQDGDTVLTHCNSSAALGVIKEAHAQGKAVKVYATESRPWRQGLLTVRELSDAGVDVTLIIDSAVRSVMKKTDKVFVGADTVASNGALINKIGTSQLALSADEARVPFSVCTETYKFSPMTMFGDMVEIEERDCGEVVGAGDVPEGVKIYNPVFDTTPAKYIDAIITEIGVLSPGSVYDVMVRQLGNDIFKVRDVQ
ncbi:MAG: ribose 1,5-bisphosphate isomerase [Methanomassiliicoccaceae archaeon]|nr:ribose 1,5-bisphosphate isomerase [Methanomassiliicoccaceae archaeon]